MQHETNRTANFTLAKFQNTEDSDIYFKVTELIELNHLNLCNTVLFQPNATAT